MIRRNILRRIAIGGNNDVARHERAGRGRHVMPAVALLPACDARVPVDLHSGIGGGAREAAHIVQEMDAEDDIPSDAAMELRRPQALRLQPIDIEELKLLAEETGHEIALFFELGPT